MANLSINTEVKADMKLEGSIHVVVESRRKKGVETGLPINMTMTTMPMKEPMPTETTPIKSNQNSLEKDLGSTQLRKTVFKKHYSDSKSRLLGEPGTMKGSYDNRNPFPTD